MTSISQGRSSESRSSPQKPPQGVTSLQVPRVAHPSHPTYTMFQPSESETDQTDKRQTSTGTGAGNRPVSLFSAQAFAAFSAGQTRPQKPDDARHPRVYYPSSFVSATQVTGNSGAQTSNPVICKDFGSDFPGFVFPGSKNSPPVSQEPQSSPFRFNGNSQEQIRPSATSPRADKWNV